MSPKAMSTTTMMLLLLAVPLLVVLLLLEVLLLVEMMRLLMVRLVVLPRAPLHSLRSVRWALLRDEASSTRHTRWGTAILHRPTTGLLYAGRVVHSTCRRRRSLRQ